MHRGAPVARTHRFDCIAILARSRVRVTHEPHVAAQWKCRDLPACAAFVETRPKYRAEPQAENLGVNASPTANNIVAVFMHRDDDQKRQYERSKRPDYATE